MDQDERKPLLEIAPYHRSEAEAREYVGRLAQRLGVTSFKSKLTSGKSITIPTTGRPMVVNLRTEVRQARVTGIPPAMQGLIDNSDRFMPPAISLGVSAGGKVKISVTIGSHMASIDGDGILEPPASALANDVLYYRREAVAASAEHRLASIARAYRTYLQVCVSLVDAFLGHATFALAAVNPKITDSEDYNVIRSPAAFASRIDAWCRLFKHPPESFRQSKCWSDLSKLRVERNRYVHPAEPVYSLGIDEIVNVLNQCRDGVGGTLECFREMAGLSPYVSYIQQVKTAPIIKKSKHR